MDAAKSWVHPSLSERWDPAVRIVDHDASWAEQARVELERIAAALGARALRVEHIGSTSVPGLASKPIVDLQLSIAGIATDDGHVAPLEAIGYLFLGAALGPEHHLFGLPAQRPRRFHLHAFEAGSHDEHRHLAVRDYLRVDAEEASAYERVKRAAAERHPEDRIAYMAYKDGHVGGLETRALAWVAVGRPGR